MNSFISDFRHDFRRHRQLAQRAMGQLDDDAFFRAPGEQVNPIALIVKHLAGNLLSRWTDFLTTDGDKPTRNRDNEFALGANDSRSHLIQQWNAGWSALEQTLDSLRESDLSKTITIRGEAHTVQQALLRGMSHVAYHVGQILYLVRLLKPDATWLTIAPGQSRQHKASYRKT